ncbi:hypothetical protein ABZ922_20105 [Streptomyces shenzhenensis]
MSGTASKRVGGYTLSTTGRRRRAAQASADTDVVDCFTPRP